MQKTLVIIKPDAVKRRLIGRIIQRFEDKGFTILKMKMRHLSHIEAELLYEEHKDADYYFKQCEFMTSGPCVVVVLGMDTQIADITEAVRIMMGQYGVGGRPGTIRGDFGLEMRENLVHGSDSVAAAEREIQIFF